MGLTASRSPAPGNLSRPSGRLHGLKRFPFSYSSVERAFRDCFATLPRLRGSRNFPTCTRGLRPGLTSTPPLRGYFDRGVEFCSTAGPHFRLRHRLFSPRYTGLESAVAYAALPERKKGACLLPWKLLN